MSSPQQPHSPYPPQGDYSPYQNQPYQQSPQQQYYPPQQPYYPQQSPGGSGYDLPPAIHPVSSDDQPKRNTPIRVLCILFAVYHIVFSVQIGLGFALTVHPLLGFLLFCSLFATITLFILGIHKSFAKEKGQFKAIGLLFGNFVSLYGIENQPFEWVIFNSVKSLFFFMVYLGVSFQKQQKFLRYFAPLQWNYGPAQ
jgi:hypothetical protein